MHYQKPKILERLYSRMLHISPGISSLRERARCPIVRQLSHHYQFHGSQPPTSSTTTYRVRLPERLLSLGMGLQMIWQDQVHRMRSKLRGLRRVVKRHGRSILKKHLLFPINTSYIGELYHYRGRYTFNWRQALDVVMQHRHVMAMSELEVYIDQNVQMKRPQNGK
jgi:hypothetical protein